jgi:hypothetical protein
MVGTATERGGRRIFRRPVCLVVLGLLSSLGAAGALAAVVLPGRQATALTHSLSVHAEPSSRTVVPGASASYVVNVSRANRGSMGLSGRTGLDVRSSELPAGAGISFGPQRGLTLPRALRQRTVLTVTTAPDTPAGTYTLRVRAHRPQRSGSARISLVVSGPAGSVAPAAAVPPTDQPPVRAPEAFVIAGTLTTPLTPGSGQPLELTLTNRESSDLAISSLLVTVADIDAPRSDPSHPCDAGDFSVEQFSGAAGFTLPALGTVSLGALGFSASEWPQVSMLNLPVNQDGCKAASLSLTFAGTATEVTP